VKIGKDPDALAVGIVNHEFDPVPCEILDLNIGVLGDIRPVVEVKRNREGVRVDKKSQSGDQSCGHEMAPDPGPVLFLRSRARALLRKGGGRFFSSI